MKVIIDGGGTKADWLFMDTSGNTIKQFESLGYSPILNNSDSFQNSFLSHKDKPQLSSVEEVFYYGTGCSTPATILAAQKTLKSLFPTAVVQVNNDLIGAARATYQGKPAVVAILGTGSNSCLYNGSKIVDQVSNLGYLLGDEGGGYAIGKEVLRSFFYRELPPNLTIAFQDQYQLRRNELIDQIYKSSSPNRDIAAFAEFAVLNRSEKAIKKIVKQVFQEFIDRNLLKYQITTSIPIHFVGSISYIFRNKLEQLLEENNLLPGIFLRKPIEGLAQYHSQNNRRMQL